MKNYNVHEDFEKYKRNILTLYSNEVALGCTCEEPMPVLVNYWHMEPGWRTDPDCPLHGGRVLG